MGDMKTPDFDDLLAAFDIPDMDASEAIHSGPEDGEGAAKPAVASGESVVSDHGLPHSDITAVSVIVKNTVCPEQAELLDLKEVPALGPRLLQNGFSSPPGPANGGESWTGPRTKTKPADLFTDLDLIDRPKERPLFEAPPPAEVAPATFAKMAADSLSAHVIKQEPAEEESPPAPAQSAAAEPPAETPAAAKATSPEVQKEAEPNAVKAEPCWTPPSDAEEEEDEDGVGSPSFNSSRPLKVRIKTIKTQSGSITRTVTAVSSDSAPEEPSQLPPPEEETSSQVPAPLPSPQKLASPCKAEASTPAKVPLGNGGAVKFPGPILPVSTIQNASSVMLMAASVAQQKAVVVPSKTASKVVAKNIFHLVQQPLAGAPPAAGATTASPQRNATVVLVQSQKAAAPPVTSTVISRTQSSLVESFNKILNSKNLLPTYKPNLAPPADASLALPVFGFRCLECGDSFALEKSLARHYDRRSMRIEVTCNHCTKRLVFFNKCSLLLHARKHKDNGLVMQCSHLVMRPIALEQMIGQPDVTPLVSLAVLAPGKATTPGPAQDAAAATTPSPTGDPALLPEQATYSTFRCLECKEQCKNKAGLAQHFQQMAPNTNIGSMVCPLCPMMMPNRCSFEAHQRMHKQTPPNVCPECGGNFRIENFQTHLKETCLHFSRRIGYRCQSCALVFGGVNSIKSHIQTAHCEVFHKCPICPMAFKSAPSAHAHIYTQHPGFSNQQAKMIYKCAMCDTVFTHKPLLCSHLDHAHFDQQLGNQRVSVFKCPECPLLFAQKKTMLEHLRTTHNSVLKEDPPQTPEPVTPKPEPVEIPLSQPPDPEPEAVAEPDPEVEESSSSESPSSPEVKKKAKPKDVRKPDAPRQRSNCWTCGICHSWFPERDEYVVHMKREHGKSVKKFPCRLCDRSFCSAPSLRRHVRVNHEGIKRVYPCRYCTEGKRTFSSRLILEKHIQVRHGIKITDQTRSQEVMVTRNIRSQATMRKRKLSTDESGSDEPEKSAPVLPKAKRSFQCRVCGYKTASLSDFRQHIPQHCTDESSHQCRECGMCFTSQGSLSRHRVMTHKMKGAPPPEEEEGGPQPKVEETTDGKLACQVCNKTFDSQLNLNTHFRTHGMAFIKQRQSGAGDN